jgi:hypothetical protein
MDPCSSTDQGNCSLCPFPPKSNQCCAKCEYTGKRCNRLRRTKSSYCKQHSDAYNVSRENYKSICSNLADDEITYVKTEKEAKEYDNLENYTNKLRYLVPNIQRCIKARERHTSYYFTQNSVLPEDVKIKDDFKDCKADPDHNIIVKRLKKAFHLLRPIYNKWRTVEKQEQTQEVKLLEELEELEEEEGEESQEEKKEKEVPIEQENKKNKNKRKREKEKKERERKEEEEKKLLFSLPKLSPRAIEREKESNCLKQIDQAMYYVPDYKTNQEAEYYFQKNVIPLVNSLEWIDSKTGDTAYIEFSDNNREAIIRYYSSWEIELRSRENLTLEEAKKITKTYLLAFEDYFLEELKNFIPSISKTASFLPSNTGLSEREKKAYKFYPKYSSYYKVVPLMMPILLSLLKFDKYQNSAPLIRFILDLIINTFWNLMLPAFTVRVIVTTKTPYDQTPIFRSEVMKESKFMSIPLGKTQRIKFLGGIATSTYTNFLWLDPELKPHIIRFTDNIRNALNNLLKIMQTERKEKPVKSMAVLTNNVYIYVSLEDYLVRELSKEVPELKKLRTSLILPLNFTHGYIEANRKVPSYSDGIKSVETYTSIMISDLKSLSSLPFPAKILRFLIDLMEYGLEFEMIKYYESYYHD